MEQPPPVPGGAPKDGNEQTETADETAQAGGPPPVPDAAAGPPPVPDHPPPTPGGPPPQRRGTVPVPDVTDIHPEDQSFIERAFAAVKNVDFRSPPPPPPKGLSGVDKKLQGLRENVRRLERDLARVGWIWAIKEERVREVDGIIARETARREQSDRRYEQITQQAQASAAENKATTERMSARIAELEAIQADLEGKLAALTEKHDNAVKTYEERIASDEAKRVAYVEEVKKKMTEAEAAFGQLREQSTGAINTLETTVKERDESIEELKAAQAEELKRLNQEHVETVTRLEAEHREALDKEHSEHKQSSEALHEKHEAALHELNEQRDGDLDRLRQEHADERSGLVAQIADKDETVRDRDGKVADLEHRIEALEKDVDTAKDETGATAKRLGERLSEREKTIQTLTEEMAATRNEYKEQVLHRDKEVDTLRDELKAAHAQTEDIRSQLGAAQGKIADLEKAASAPAPAAEEAADGES